MVKAKASDIKKQLEEEQEEIYGDQDNPEMDDDVDEMFKKAVGHKPIRGKTLADEVRGAEDSRRGKQAHKKGK